MEQGTKTILVAGGAGFIGSHLCQFLIDKGHSVIIVDNLITGRLKNVQSLLDTKKVQFIEHDIRHPLKISEKIDQIYNMASPASPKDFAEIPIEILQTGSLGQQNLLVLAKEKKARILFASTSEVYGDAEVHPQPETYFGNVNSIGARSCYDEAKRYGEALTMAFHKKEGVNTCISRIFNTYGPNMAPNDGRILPNFFSQALRGESLTIYGDGSQTRSFCYVSDLVEGHYALMESKEHTPINIGNPTERTVLEMANIVNQLTGNRAEHKFYPLPENDPLQRRPDISKAKNLLSWQPQIDLKEGLEKIHAYFKEELS